MIELIENKENPIVQMEIEEVKNDVEKNVVEDNIMDELAENIICYISGASFKEEILGYGVYKDKNLLSTPSELLSYKEYTNGIRLSSSKISFTHYLPAFICPSHSI